MNFDAVFRVYAGHTGIFRADFVPYLLPTFLFLLSAMTVLGSQNQRRKRVEAANSLGLEYDVRLEYGA